MRQLTPGVQPVAPATEYHIARQARQGGPDQTLEAYADVVC